MSSWKEKLIKIIASSVFWLRKKALSDISVKWIVCSGSVGKTIARRSIVDSLFYGGEEIFTLKTDYCNEFGVILSLLQVNSFSFFSLRSWIDIFTIKPKENSCIAIELGADFRLDVDWFLSRWTPDIIVLTKATDTVWTPVINAVLESRLHLCRAAKEAVYVSVLDDVHLNLLNQSSVIFFDIEHGDDIYAYPEGLIRELGKNEHFDLNKVNIFTSKRFSLEQFGSNYLLQDTYKVTPICFDYFVDRLLETEGSETVLIMNEIRPLLAKPADIYQPFISRLEKIGRIYFVGDKTVYDYLTGQLDNIEQISIGKLPSLNAGIKKKIKEGTVSLGIKMSSYYSTEQV